MEVRTPTADLILKARFGKQNLNRVRVCKIQGWKAEIDKGAEINNSYTEIEGWVGIVVKVGDDRAIWKGFES